MRTPLIFLLPNRKKSDNRALKNMYEQNAAHQQWLEEFLRELNAVAGSVHEQCGEDLYLTAAHNLPSPVIAAVAVVPRGKGMAGLAQVGRAPVQTCNLQTDNSGAVKPGAKAVNAQAGIAVPVLNEAGDVVAVVGAAWMTEGDIAPDRERAIMEAAASLPLGGHQSKSNAKDVTSL
jgi:L-methionine (R)-S-oxide reductase